MTSPPGVDVPGYAEGWLPEDAALTAARARAREVGVGSVSPLGGALLRFLAAVTAAGSVAEVGTGAGVSGLWLLRGMRTGGVLTSIDSEAEHQRLARVAFRDAEVPGARVRLIGGRAQEVLPRLADGAYDLVHLDAPLEQAMDLLADAVRVLRPGGVLAVAGALAGGRVADAGARDPDAVAGRALLRAVRDDDRLVPALLPLPAAAGPAGNAGDAGLLVAARP